MLRRQSVHELSDLGRMRSSYTDRTNSYNSMDRSDRHSRSPSRSISRCSEISYSPQPRRYPSRSRSRSRSRRSRSVHKSNDSVKYPRRNSPEPSRCLGVFGLSFYTTERDLKEIFERYGELEKVQIVFDHPTGRSRGFAFVYFKHVEDSIEAKERIAGTEIDGHRVRVDFSLTKRAHTPTPGIYMGASDNKRRSYRRTERQPSHSPYKTRMYCGSPRYRRRSHEYDNDSRHSQTYRYTRLSPPRDSYYHHKNRRRHRS